jgi:hypothetical protein
MHMAARAACVLFQESLAALLSIPHAAAAQGRHGWPLGLSTESLGNAISIAARHQ